MKKLFLIIFIPVLFIEYSNSQSRPKKVIIEPKKSLKKEIYYIQNGEMNGIYSFYYNNRKQVEGKYLNNSKTGEWKYFDNDGNVRIKGSYLENKETGVWFYYKKDTLISKLLFDKNSRIDTFYGYWPTGQIAQIKIIDRIKNTEYSTKYYENNKIYEKSTKVSGKLDGFLERFDNNGNKTLEIEYKKGNPYSLILTSDNKLFRDSYSGNLKNGNGVLYIKKQDPETKNFQLYIELNFQNGLLSGNYYKYHSNGKISRKGQFSNNYLNGIFEFYDESGKLDTTKEYQKSDQLKNDLKNGITTNYSDENIIIDKMPGFLENDYNYFRYHIQRKLRYPEVAAENGIQGKVFVQFSVNSVGQVVDAKIVRSVDPSLDSEVLRVVNNSPYWEPGYQYFIPVKVQFTFPVVFALQ